MTDYLITDNYDATYKVSKATEMSIYNGMAIFSDNDGLMIAMNIERINAIMRVGVEDLVEQVGNE